MKEKDKEKVAETKQPVITSQLDIGKVDMNNIEGNEKFGDNIPSRAPDSNAIENKVPEVAPQLGSSNTTQGTTLNQAPVDKVASGRSQPDNKRSVTLTDGSNPSSHAGGIPSYALKAWNDLAESIPSVWAKWPSKLVSFEIFKEWLEGKK
jgi:hypothetical protein